MKNTFLAAMSHEREAARHLRAVPTGADVVPRTPPGTGIGLSLVAMFADLHGGRPWAEDREGGGASFRVFLPGDTADHRTGTGQRQGAPTTVASEAAG